MDFTSFLPEEVSEKVFSYLTPQELCRTSLCSKKWRELCNRDSTWLYHCKRKGWLRYGHQVDLLNLKSSSNVCRNVSGTSPSFMPLEASHLNIGKIGKWKNVYLGSHHLKENWKTGRYTVTIVRGHKQKVNAIDISGDLLVSGSADKTLRLWHLPDYSCVRKIESHPDSITQVKIWGRLVVSACADSNIRLFEIKTGQLTLTLKGHNSSVDFLQFDGNLLISGDAGSNIKVWDVAKAKLLHTLRVHTDELECMFVYKNYVLTGSWDCTLRLFCAVSGEKEQEFKGHSEVVTCCQFDVTRTVSGSADATVKIWSTLSGRCLKTMQCSGEVYCVIYNKEVIAAGTAESMVHIWSYSGEPQHSLKGNHLGVIRCLHLDKDKLVSGGDQKKITIWDYRSGKLLNTIHRNPTLLHKMMATDIHLITASPERPGTVTILTYW